MIDERRIDDKAKYGTQYDVGNITLYVTTEFWGGRWHIPTIVLLAPRSDCKDQTNALALDYDTLTDISAASQRAQREWMRVEKWRLEKDREISKKTLGAS